MPPSRRGSGSPIGSPRDHRVRIRECFRDPGADGPGRRPIDLVGDSLGVQFEIQRSDEPVTILMGEVTEEENPISGQTMLLRTDAQTPYRDVSSSGPSDPRKWETVPPAYFIPSGAGGGR